MRFSSNTCNMYRGLSDNNDWVIFFTFDLALFLCGEELKLGPIFCLLSNTLSFAVFSTPFAFRPCTF